MRFQTTVIAIESHGLVRIHKRDEWATSIAELRTNLAEEILLDEARACEGARLASLIGITGNDILEAREVELSDSEFQLYKNMPDQFFIDNWNKANKLGDVVWMMKLAAVISRMGDNDPTGRNIQSKRATLQELNEITQFIRSVLKYTGQTAIRSREAIPENVRHEVWRRDEGKCVTCGSQVRLEFDHIIPHSKGGASTARNLQLLCEICNRSKSDAI